MKISFRPSRKILFWLVPLLLFLLAFAISRGPVDALWLNAPGWSRARLVGNTQADQAVPIALDDAGQIYLLLFPADAAPGSAHVVALNRQAEAIWERALELSITRPKSPQLLWDGKAIELFWLGDQHLYTAQLDTAGTTLVPAKLLSGDTTVDSYAAAADAQGRVAVWYGGARQAPGVYALPTGDLSGPAALVDPAGLQPVLRFDSAGTLHAIWVADSTSEQRATDVYYAAYPDGIYRAGQRGRLMELAEHRVGIDLDGPWFGLDRQYGYLIWKVMVRAGFFTQYISFPLDKPSKLSEVRPLTVPGSAVLAYQPSHGGGFEAGPRVSLVSDPSRASASPSEITINPAAEQELVLANETQVDYKSHQVIGQASTLFFQDGAPAAYQLLSFTSNAAFTPAIISDRARYLYVTWREIRSPGFHVYFASTAPDIKQALRSLTIGDISRITVDTVFGLLTGALFSPLTAVLWLIAPLLLLALTWVTRRGDGRMARWGTPISLALGVGAYWVSKLVTFERDLTYVPFSEWIPLIPSWLAIPLRFGAPIIIFVVAIRTAWHYTYRKERRSAVLFMLVYAGVDSLLTMAIYGGLLLGTFGPHQG